MKIATRIAALRPETPTVRVVTLDLGGRSLPYHPGQWIDCTAEIRGRQELAGYSLASSPTTRGTVELAVRSSDSPVSRFLHDEARPGDTLWIDGGQGETYYTQEMGGPLVLIGGGIGISVLMSILRYVDAACPGVPATLVYSARSPAEIVYRAELAALAARNPDIRIILTVTREAGPDWTGPTGRIDTELLRRAEISPAALFFVCGPPGLRPGVTERLTSLGADPSRIRHEDWW